MMPVMNGICVFALVRERGYSFSLNTRERGYSGWLGRVESVSTELTKNGRKKGNRRGKYVKQIKTFSARNQNN